VPKGCTNDTLVLQFNDCQGLEDAFRNRGSEIAGVILEPVVGNMGLVEPTREFLIALRTLTERHGALLIFDEVMTGFRLAYGGAQQILKMRPDVTVLGKIIGGGLPVGAYGGRADIMKKILPAGPVFQAGTLSGNPLAMAAGIATLRELKEKPPYNKLERLSKQLCDGIADAAKASGHSFTLNRVGSMWTLFFAPGPVRDYESAKKSDTKKFARFFWQMMDRGVYLPCSQFEAAFVSAAHTEEQISDTVGAARDALAKVEV